MTWIRLCFFWKVWRVGSFGVCVLGCFFFDMWHRYLVAFELALMGTGKFFEGILIVENTSAGAHRSSDPSTIVLQYCDER